jgi:hypothetical protein
MLGGCHGCTCCLEAVGRTGLRGRSWTTCVCEWEPQRGVALGRVGAAWVIPFVRQRIYMLLSCIVCVFHLTPATGTWAMHAFPATQHRYNRQPTRCSEPRGSCGSCDSGGCPSSGMTQTAGPEHMAGHAQQCAEARGSTPQAHDNARSRHGSRTKHIESEAAECSDATGVLRQSRLKSSRLPPGCRFGPCTRSRASMDGLPSTTA